MLSFCKNKRRGRELISQVLKVFVCFLIIAVSLLQTSVASADIGDVQRSIFRSDIRYFDTDPCVASDNSSDQPPAAGNIPAGGKDVGATEFTDAEGYHGDGLDGTYSYAELSPLGTDAQDVSQETATNLGGLSYKQKLAITYKNKTVVAEKLDIGQGGPDVGGKTRAIDLHFDKTVKALGISDPNNWSGVVHVQGVVDKTPLGPVDDPAKLVDSGNAALAGPADTSQTGSCCSGATSATLIGKDNEEKTWNYFKGRGLGDEQTAGIMGNLMQESSFNPTVMEKGGNSNNPADADPGGWGLIQWTPGSKVIDEAKQAGVKGKIYELSTQLDLVWQHMHNHPVVTQPFDLDHFKTLTNEVDAATYFGSQIEGFGIAGSRFQYATDLLHKYAGKTATGNPGISQSDCTSATGSPDCQTATGTAKILCEAEKYNPVSYVWGGGHAGGEAYHKACPTINASDSACGLDCSGLVSIAVYDAFANSGSWDTTAIVSDSTNWKEISVSQLQAGDLIEPDPWHVEIIDHVNGRTIFTFGAHTSNVKQPFQVGKAQYTVNSGSQYFRYVGQGLLDTLL